MKFALILLIFAQFGFAAAPARAEYSDEVCEDFQKVAREFIDMELAGLRWQGVMGKPQCLSKLSTRATSIDRVPASDPSLLNPEYILPENRSIDFTVKRIPGDLIEVMMNYIGKKNKKDVAVQDHFILRMNFGKAREAKGCASWYTEPLHFVMRSRCWKK